MPFQYISCYSLSYKDMIDKLLPILFQYISCYSLSYYGCKWYQVCLVSIHLMLLFIKRNPLDPQQIGVFQYISCYSLPERFGTIGVYPVLFQYIPCYSLSVACLEYSSVSSTFQYIPCYSLSFATFYNQKTCNRFNTSHVTLYRGNTMTCTASDLFQYIPCYSLSAIIKGYVEKKIVSIHPMLLFIN